jgi:hypothetical protein
MVLTDEERAELQRLQAKEAEPAAAGATLHLSLAADVADVIQQLVQVHWASIAPEVGQAFQQAYAEAKAALESEPEPAEPAPAEPADDGALEPAEPAAAFGTEDDPGTEPTQ